MKIWALVAAFALAWLLAAPVRAATLTLQSARVDYAGVELTLVFSVSTPADYSHPFLTTTVLTLTDGTNTQNPTAKGGNFDVEGGNLIWTLRYRLNSRITTTMSNFTVSWSGSAATDSFGNNTGSGSGVAVTNDSRVDSQGWSVLGVRSDAGVAAVEPDEMDGLYAWYDTGSGQLYQNTDGTGEATQDGHRIAYWKDRSNNGRHFIQSDADHKPQLKTNVVNGHRVVQFDAPNNSDVKGLMCASFGLDPSSPMSVFAVVRLSVLGQGEAKTGLEQVLHQGTTSFGHLRFTSSTSRKLEFTTAISTVEGKENIIQDVSVFGQAREWLVVGGAWTGASAQGWNLGFQVFNNTSDENTLSGAWAIGCKNGTPLLEGLHGEIAEIVVFDEALSDQNAKALTSYFMDKYNIRPRKVHVSSSTGNDSNNGLSAAGAKLTPTAGAALVRPGLGDQCLFLRGSTFTEGFTVKPGWSLRYPSLYATYEPVTPVELARPLFKIDDTATASGIGVPGATDVKSIAVVGLDLYSYQRDPANQGYEFPTDNASIGLSLVGDGLHDLLIEDCVVRFFKDNIVAKVTNSQSADNIFIRRNIVHNAYNAEADTAGQNGSSIGMYTRLSEATRVLIEENVFHHNCWQSDYGTVVVFSGGTYTHSTRKVEADENAFAQFGGVATNLRFRCDAGTGVDGYGGRAVTTVTDDYIILAGTGLGSAADGQANIGGAVGTLVDAIPNIYSHNMYLDGDDPARPGDGPRGHIVRGNFSTYAASHGLQLRPGGVCDHNVFYGNAIHAFAARNDNVNSVRNPSLVWRCLFLPGRSLFVPGDPPVPDGRNWGFDANGGHDTFIFENIFAMPETITDPYGPFGEGRALSFTTRKIISGEKNRVYCRNNTIRIGDPTAAIRRHEDGTVGPHDEGTFEWNLLSQPDEEFGERLIHWEVSESLLPPTGHWSFHDNYYYSVGDDVSEKEWFRHGSTNLSATEWMSDSYTDDDTSVKAGSAPAFDDAGVDLGQYYDETFSQNGKTSEQFITEKLLTRGRLSWPSNLSARSVIDWFRGAYTPTNLPQDTNYGAVGYEDD